MICRYYSNDTCSTVRCTCDDTSLSFGSDLASDSVLHHLYCFYGPKHPNKVECTMVDSFKQTREGNTARTLISVSICILPIACTYPRLTLACNGRAAWVADGQPAARVVSSLHLIPVAHSTLSLASVPSPLQQPLLFSCQIAASRVVCFMQVCRRETLFLCSFFSLLQSRMRLYSTLLR